MNRFNLILFGVLVIILAILIHKEFISIDDLEDIINQFHEKRNT